MCYPHVLSFWRAHCFSFLRKKSHVRTSERIVFARPLPSPYAHYCAWPMLFGSRGPRKLLAVSRPFISDTSPECIDREGLERRRTGTSQARLHATVFDSRSPSTEFYVIDLTRNLFCSPLPFWELLGHPPCIFNPSSSKLSLGHFLDTNSVIYNKLSSFNSFFLFKQLWWQQWQADAFYMQHKTQYAISELPLSLCFKARLIACEPQTYFRSSPLSFRKITTVFLGGWD